MTDRFPTDEELDELDGRAWFDDPRGKPFGIIAAARDRNRLASELEAEKASREFNWNERVELSKKLLNYVDESKRLAAKLERATKERDDARADAQKMLELLRTYGEYLE